MAPTLIAYFGPKSVLQSLSVQSLEPAVPAGAKIRAPARQPAGRIDLDRAVGGGHDTRKLPLRGLITADDAGPDRYVSFLSAHRTLCVTWGSASSTRLGLAATTRAGPTGVPATPLSDRNAAS